MRKDRRKVGADGFTLIELLVVIVILGVLAAVVVIAVGQIRSRGEVNACKTEIKSVKAAIALDYDDDTNDPKQFAASVAALETGGYLDDAPQYDDGYTYTAATGAVTDNCQATYG